VAALAEEVLAVLERRAGQKPFLAALGEVQRRFLARRDKRKRGRRVEAVVDPEGHAKRRLAENRAKQAGAKRRRAAFGELRRAGGSRGTGKHRPGKGGGGKGKSARGAVGGLAGGGKSTGGFGRKRPKH
jgi:hypothetical protein